MLWRGVTALLILFWAAMTGLLLRNVYFPDHSGLAEVPTRLVFDLFLNQVASHSNTLHVYHHEEKLGHASFHVVKTDGAEEGGVALYRMTVSGGIDAVVGESQRVTSGWRLEADLRDGQELRGLKLDLTSSETNHTIMLRWREGEKLPQMEVRQGEKLVMDTQGAMAMAGMGEQMGLFGGMLGLSGSKGQAPSLRMEAREGLMDLAGRSRRCYVIRMTALDRYEVQAIFTEVGELARVDLPQGFCLREPLIHGLEPDLVER
jgi:hypothetical protein